MDPRLRKIYDELKAGGLSERQERRILEELHHPGRHTPAESPAAGGGWMPFAPAGIYGHQDLSDLQHLQIAVDPLTCLRSLDDLLEKDKQREQDGFSRKIRVGRMIKPGRGGADKVVVVPTTVEEKFIHDRDFTPPSDEQASGGAGEGEEGEVIGEQPVHAPQQGSGTGPGQGEQGPHEIESSAYDLGRILTEKFELPNIKDKGKKHFLTRYTYDLTDRHRGVGQVLDKKATLRRIVKTNISLENLTDPSAVDPSRFVISPNDMIYRVLSQEKDYESQAVVFFVRDYSGSMEGKVTELVVTQQVLIYSWLLFQYARQVQTRFILHDTNAKEVPDFHTYYNSRVAGGTRVASAYKLVNQIVKEENLAQDYNIYVFQGTDGDDWDSEGKDTLPELKQMLAYVNRMGVTIAEHASVSPHNTEVEKYLKKSNLLSDHGHLLRLDTLQESAEEARLIEGIRKLIA